MSHVCKMCDCSEQGIPGPTLDLTVALGPNLLQHGLGYTHSDPDPCEFPKSTGSRGASETSLAGRRSRAWKARYPSHAQEASNCCKSGSGERCSSLDGMSSSSETSSLLQEPRDKASPIWISGASIDCCRASELPSTVHGTSPLPTSFFCTPGIAVQLQPARRCMAVTNAGKLQGKMQANPTYW